MKAKVIKFENGEDKSHEGEFSYSENWKEGDKFVTLLSFLSDKTEGNFDLELMFSAKEIDTLISDLELLKKQINHSE